ncbi:hypothetical protein SteCoe_1276 [Stentor coeruleus]|uniref:PKD/REJ-like domain-containing protein n=1 Tax=Stentor coeruleus TaxID=5963 RepID=A0A1R2D294_9CILI|nr:hypothetical protein SteCoe_1276 [Stentor coeruleus]
MISNEGVYKIQALSEGVEKAISLEFVIYGIYLKVELIGLNVKIIQPNYAIDVFIIKVNVFIGVDFIRLFSDKDFEVSLSLEPEYELKGQTIKITSLGEATFNDLFIDEIGTYKIHALAEGIYYGVLDSSVVIEDYCPDGQNYDNGKCITCIQGAVWNNDLSLCECLPDTYEIDGICQGCPDGMVWDEDFQVCGCLDEEVLFNNTCILCIQGKVWNYTTNICECPIGEHFIDNLCKKCQEGAEWNELNSLCQCPENEYLTSLSCITCKTGEIFNSDKQICECPENQYLLNNICTICYRWLQSYDITGSLTNYLKDLVFNFTLTITPVPCEILFPFSLISKLGIDYSCEYPSDNNSLIVHLGYGNTITTETISLNNGFLKGTSYVCGYQNTSLSIKLVYLEPIPHPQAIILAPSTVFYECQNLDIDGSLSFAGIGTVLTYQWRVTSSILGFKNIIQDFSTKKILQIISSNLIEGIINIELTVKNVLNIQSTTTKSVSISKSTFLIIEFDKTIDYSCPASSTCMFSIKKLNSCFPSNDYNIKWSLINNDIISPENYKLFLTYQNVPGAIKIPANLFPPSILYFTVSVFSNKTLLSGSENLSINILTEGPVFILHPLSGSVSTLSSFTLDASRSYDPSLGGDVVYSWFCSYKNSECLFEYEKNKSTMTVPKEAAEAQSVDFINISILIYTTHLRSLTEFILSITSVFEPTFVKWIVPKVYISEYYTNTQPIVTSLNKPFVLKAVIEENNEKYTPEWEIIGIDEVYNTPTNQFIISVNPSKLVPGMEYTLRFLATDSNNYESFFDYIFSVNTPPIPGNFSVSPRQGVEVETVFEFIANGWTDFEENYPLSYVFGYTLNNANVILLPYSQTAYGKIVLPYLGKLVKVFLKVFDNLEDFTETNTTIEMIVNENIDPSSYVSTFENLIQTALPDEIPLTLLTFASLTVNRDLSINGIFINHTADILSDMNTNFNIGIDWFLQTIGTFLPTSNTLDLNIEILNTFTLNPYLKSDDNLNKTINTLNEILTINQDLGLDISQANRALNILTNSLDLNKDTLYNKTKNLEKISSLIDFISSGVIKNTVDNQNASTINKYISMDTKSIPASSLGNLTLKSSSGSGASVILPEDFANVMDLDLDNIYAISLTHLDTIPSEYNSTPTIVAVSAFLVSESIKVDVELKDKLIYVRIPVYNVKSIESPECFYLDENSKKWSKKGCKKVSMDDESILCACNHLSFFSAGEGMTGGGFIPKSNIGETVDFEALDSMTASTAEGFYFVACMLFIYIILAIITFYKDKKDLEKTIDKINNPTKHHTTEHTKRVRKSSVKMVPVTIPKSLNSEKSQSEEEEKDTLSVPEIPKKQIMLKENAVEEDNSLDEIDFYLQKDEVPQTRRGIYWMFQQHKFFGIFMVYDPVHSRIIRCSLFFTVILGRMFLIGLFYQKNDDKSDDGFLERLRAYNIRDFAIMVYSSLIMIFLEIVVLFVLTEKKVQFESGKEAAMRVIKRNKYMRISSLIFCWTALGYFCWSIGMFALHFPQGVSHMWILNTIISLIVDILFTSFIKIAIVTLIILRVLDYWKKYKEKKIREMHESIDSEDRQVVI